MANAGAAQVIAKVLHARYAARIRDAFGDRVLDDEAPALKAACCCPWRRFNKAPLSSIRIAASTTHGYAMRLH